MDQLEKEVRKACLKGEILRLDQLLRQGGLHLLDKLLRRGENLLEEIPEEFKKCCLPSVNMPSFLETICVLAIKYRYARIVKRMLTSTRAEWKDKVEERLMYFACSEGDVETVRYLLKPLHQANIDQCESMFEVVLQNNHLEVLSVLLTHCSRLFSKTRLGGINLRWFLCTAFRNSTVQTCAWVVEWCMKRDDCTEDDLISSRHATIYDAGGASVREEFQYLQKLDLLLQLHVRKNFSLENFFQECDQAPCSYPLMVSYGYPLERVPAEYREKLLNDLTLRKEVTRNALLDFVPDFPEDLIEQAILGFVNYY